MHSNSRGPCEIREMLKDTIILLTPHGFQSLLTLFLPNTRGLTPTSGIVPLLYEIFPYRYYKRAYGPLSKEIGEAIVCVCIVCVYSMCI